ncbi:MAG: hypothetical protein ABIJ37_00640 [Pseudomonadota bacterium]
MITAPFQRISKPKGLLIHEDRYLTPSKDKHIRQASLFTEENEDTKDEANGKSVFRFHCWKCGEVVKVDKSKRNDIIECKGCGTRLEIPNK